MQLVERFQTAPFEEIAAHCGARVSPPLTLVTKVTDLCVLADVLASVGAGPRV